MLDGQRDEMLPGSRSAACSLVPHDTSREAARVQYRIWREMGCQGRIALAFESSDNLRRVLAEGIRRRRPQYNEEQVRLAVIRLTMGDELFRLAYPAADIGDDA